MWLVDINRFFEQLQSVKDCMHVGNINDEELLEKNLRNMRISSPLLHIDVTAVVG